MFNINGSLHAFYQFSTIILPGELSLIYSKTPVCLLSLGSLKCDKPSSYSADRGDLLSLFTDGPALQDGRWCTTLCTVGNSSPLSLKLALADNTFLVAFI